MSRACGHVPDCGCEAGGPCCVSCPLPVCVFDVGGPANASVVARGAKILAALEAGETRDSVAERFSVSLRTVSRIRRKAGWGADIILAGDNGN